MTRKILIYGNPILKQKSLPLEADTAQLRGFIDDLAETLYLSDEGIGLAAPQVGELIRALVVDIDHISRDKRTKPKRRLQVFINPEIVWESEDDVSYNEGCLSVPGVDGKIYRPQSLVLRFRDLSFKEKEIEADGLLARVLQHEIDHLNGTLFVDRLGFAQRALLAGKLRNLRQEALKQGEDANKEKPDVPIL